MTCPSWAPAGMSEEVAPWRRLAAAILLQAARDAQAPRPWPECDGPGGPQEARAWLMGETAMWVADELGMGEMLQQWLRQVGR